jgi:predicted AlkP superfamily phosphohydrolase/phosphomutase
LVSRRAALTLLAAAIVLVPATAHAYVGPGAGVAIAGTALALLTSLVLVVVGILIWPIRAIVRMFTRKRPPDPPIVKRAVVIGLDGLDPDLVDRFMAEGKLPNLERIAARGSFRRLRTTFPAMSPVAWSSFATGVNPAKHGIFDFLTRDPHSYQPDLSSAHVAPPRRHISIGSLRVPIGKPELRLLRKSKPFWEILGRHRVPCSILRVPITFPPQKFDGTMLSAMCVPDLQGSQGTFTYYASDAGGSEGTGGGEETTGGERVAVTIENGRVETYLEGPPNPMRRDGRRLRVKLTATLAEGGASATLRVGRKTIEAKLDQHTDWVEIAFPMALGLKLRGICQFRLLAAGDAFRLYVTPINIDPARPILPISHPRLFSIFLAKLIGRFSTLGLAEDTWALNEGVIDEDAFLDQAWTNHREREAMFFQMLDRTPRGVITCVFDGTDRIQHMFMRYLDDGHPALTAEERDSPHRSVIEDTYCRMDEMVGRVLDKVDIADPETLVAVISDHGFKTFRRGVNLNTWLRDNGYLVLEDGRTETGEWFDGVDWDKTRAFALGLGGIFLNVRGREGRGIVEPGAAANALADEIAAKLTGMVDPECDAVGIRKAYPCHTLYRGPYADRSPDLIVGYAAGWRASWNGVRGIVDGVVFDDNTKAWSGDHCIDPDLVPGVLIANRALGSEGDPQIADMAPTLLALFGIPAPAYMDGTSLVNPA